MPIAACEIPKPSQDRLSSMVSTRLRLRGQVVAGGTLSGTSVLIAQFDRNRTHILFTRRSIAAFKNPCDRSLG